MFPALPPWEDLHPLVIHFPIALLMVSPLFVLLAAVLGSYGRGFALTALLLLVLGTAGASLSVATGHASRDRLPELGEDVRRVMDEHQEWGGKTRTVFLALCVLYGVIQTVPVFLRKLNRISYLFPANAGFLALLLAAIAMLVSATQSGNQLVHQYGLRGAPAADLPAPDQPAAGETLQSAEPAAREDVPMAAEALPVEASPALAEPAGLPSGEEPDEPSSDPGIPSPSDKTPGIEQRVAEPPVTEPPIADPSDEPSGEQPAVPEQAPGADQPTAPS